MKLLVTLFTFLFMTNTYAVKLMTCKSQKFNPYYYFHVEQNESKNIYDTTGKLVKAINGITGEDTEKLWKDYLDFYIDDYNCLLEVYSSKKSLDEFSVYLRLDDLKGDKLIGTLTGSLITTRDQVILCQINNKDFFQRIKSTCIKR